MDPNPSSSPFSQPAATGLSPFRKELGEQFRRSWERWRCERDEPVVDVARRYFVAGGQAGHQIAAQIVQAGVRSLAEQMEEELSRRALAQLGERIGRVLADRARAPACTDALAERFAELWRTTTPAEQRREIIPRRQLAEIYFTAGGRCGMEAAAVLVHDLFGQITAQHPGSASGLVARLADALPRSIVESI